MPHLLPHNVLYSPPVARPMMMVKDFNHFGNHDNWVRGIKNANLPRLSKAPCDVTPNFTPVIAPQGNGLLEAMRALRFEPAMPSQEESAFWDATTAIVRARNDRRARINNLIMVRYAGSQGHNPISFVVDDVTPPTPKKKPRALWPYSDLWDLPSIRNRHRRK
jgi:hypothetical protein